MIIDEDKYIEKLEQDLKLAGWTNSIEANTYYSIMRLSGTDCILYIDDKPAAIIEIKVSRNQKIILEALKQARIAPLKINNSSLPFIYIYCDGKIIFQDLKDISSNPKEIKRFYSPDEMKKMLSTIPYGPTNVTNNIDVFLKYLKLAIILIYNNRFNVKLEQYFSSRFSDDKFYSINNHEYGIKRILQFAYFLFSEIYLLNLENTAFNLTSKRLDEIKLEDYNSSSYKINLLNNTEELINIPQGKRISQNNNIITINFAKGFVRDTESYAIPIYDKFRATDEDLIQFGESIKGKVQDFIYKCTTRLDSDKPASEDYLDRKDDARRLASFLMHQETQTPLNFAIVSNWGTGKSSFVEFMDGAFRELKPKHKKSEYKKPKIIRFNAWQYNNEQQIGVALLNKIYSELNWFDKIIISIQEFFKNKQYIFTSVLIILITLLVYNFVPVHSFLENKIFSNSFMDNFIKLTSLFLGSGGIIALICKSFKYLEKIFGKLSLYKYDNLCRKHLDLKHLIKDEVSKVCKLQTKRNERLIVFIDDLDRCKQEAIITLLDALSIYFSSDCDVIAILNIDINIIIGATNKKLGQKNKNNNAAARYLEKIIQLNYNLPKISAPQYNKLLSSLLPCNDSSIHSPLIKQADAQPQRDNITIEKADTEEKPEENNNYSVIKLELPQDIADALKDFFLLYGDLIQFSPRKVKRIVNILRILNSDLNSNNINIEPEALTAAVCLIERYPEMSQIIASKLENTNTQEINLMAVLEEIPDRKESLLSNLNINISREHYNYIRKYIFDIGQS